MSSEQLVTWVVGAIVGAIKVPIFEFLKVTFNLSGKAAFLAVMVFSIVLAFFALLATGGFSPFDLNRLFEYMGAIIVLGQFTYALWKK